jgi:type I restriction enzyme R subunit
MTNLEFLTAEWKDLHEAALKADQTAIPDPRTSCFYARRALQLAVAWAFKFDRALKLPYQDNLSALVHEATFKRTASETIFTKAKVIITLGNRVVHSHKKIPQTDSVQAVKELLHFCYWFVRLYSRRHRPAAELSFDAAALPETTPIPKQTLEQLKRLEKQLHDKDEKLAAVPADKDTLSEEIKRLRKEVAQAKKDAEKQPDDHDYSEAETRDYFIDLLLKEAGWPLNQKQDREFPVTGMPNSRLSLRESSSGGNGSDESNFRGAKGDSGKGFVDYVLWGDDGKPLGLVEAKRTRRSPKEGEQQAKLYADCLQAMFGQRPIVFCSNGYEHWMWDDRSYPPRRVQGFYKSRDWNC